MNRSLTSKCIYMVSKHRRRYSTPHANTLEISTLKQQWVITTDPLGCLKPKMLLILVIDSTDEDVNQLGHSLIQNIILWKAVWETKHPTTIWSSNNTPWYFPNWAECLRLHKNLHMIFTAVLSITAQTCKQSRCPPGSIWARNLWYS